jgi:hypothetical protein
MEYCKAIKSDGTRCKKKANHSGYCNIHDPKEIKKRQIIANEKSKKGKPLYDLLIIITDTLKTNGWGWSTNNIDKDNFASACLFINKYYPQIHDDITAAIYIQLKADNSILYSIEKTSFHGYGLDILRHSISDALTRNGYSALKRQNNIGKQNNSENKNLILENIFSKFDLFAKQLLNRYHKRSTIQITDEYDVQDLLHAILKLHFNDIRREEYTPSHAGSNSRCDFLLCDEEVLIEVKIVRKNLSEKELSEQLIIDKERYKSHPKCKYIYCFVYDPSLILRNPNGIENDLNEISPKSEFKVYIYPK